MSNLTYEKAGVDIKGGDHWVETIKGILKQHTADPRVVGGIGGWWGPSAPQLPQEGCLGSILRTWRRRWGGLPRRPAACGERMALRRGPSCLRSLPERELRRQ